MKVQLTNYFIKPVFQTSVKTISFHAQLNDDGNDIVEISKPAAERKGRIPAYKIPTNLEKMLDISGIHCPVCGKRMFTQDKLEEVLNEFERIHSGKKYVKTLENYKDYIPTKYQKILGESKYLLQNKDMSLNEMYKRLKINAKYDKEKCVKDIKATIKEVLKDNPNKREIEVYTNIIDVRTSYSNYKEILANLCNKLKLDEDTVNLLRDKTYQDMKYNSRYLELFEGEDGKYIEKEKLARTLAEKIFGKATPVITTLHNFPEHIDHPHNTCIECGNCYDSKQKNYYWRKHQNFSDLHINAYLYLSDVARLIGQKKVDARYGYIDSFAFVSRILSKGQIDINAKELEHLSSLITCNLRHDDSFAPIEQSKVDIPCACCGSTMLPHDIKLQIENEMKKCSTPEDYAHVLIKNKKYIGSHARGLAKIFISTAKNNPDLTNEEFIELFQAKTKNYVKNKLNNALMNFQRLIPYYTDEEEIKLFDEIFYKTSKYIEDEEFADYSRAKMITQCIGNTGELKMRAAYELASDIRNALYIGNLSRNDLEKDVKDKDEIYTILFKIFSSNSATGDHLVARSNGGIDTKENTVGLCKACNQMKSKSNPNVWYFSNPGVEHNLPRQLMVIDSMAKKGQLEGYENWAHNIATIMAKETRGKLDLRELYPPATKEEV